MTPVFLFGDTPKEYPKPKDGIYPIQVTQHDMPPIISTIAQAFRFWRGDMEYRIRTVAGFATQGYTLAMPIKNAFVPIGIYDAYKVSPSIVRQDASYKSCMMNSYALADTSMFRHLEITYPYDYPTPYYDQFAWMSRRTAPSANFVLGGKTPVQNEELYISEPHGDNFIAIGLRGNLAATQTGSQIMFELEYRCSEGFQFTDPFIPSRSAICSSKTTGTQGFLPHRYPDADRKSDGLGIPQKLQDSGSQPVDSITARFHGMGTSSRRG